jgi:hypothetical protein
MRQLLTILAWAGAAAPALAQTTPAAPLPSDFPADVQALAGAALQERFTGRVYRVQPVAGPGWRLEFKDGGYAFIDLTNGARDTGRWRVEGTTLCIEWQRFNSGCSEIRVQGETLHLKRTTNGEVVALKPS